MLRFYKLYMREEERVILLTSRGIITLAGQHSEIERTRKIKNVNMAMCFFTYVMCGSMYIDPYVGDVILLREKLSAIHNKGCPRCDGLTFFKKSENAPNISIPNKVKLRLIYYGYKTF